MEIAEIIVKAKVKPAFSTSYISKKLNLFKPVPVICLTACLFLASPSVSAQATTPGEEKIESAKVAMLTTRLNLNSSQAKEFWPVYNEYSGRKKELRNSYRSSRKQLDDKIAANAISEDDIKRRLQNLIDLRQETLNTDKLYQLRFQKVLTFKQIAIMSSTDQEFTKMLLRQLDDQKK
ncbi:MAG: hypothetical protein V4543_04625 [Bacteroidota bacterium]